MAVELPFAVRPAALSNIASGNEQANRPASHLAELDLLGMVWQSSGATSVWARGQFTDGIVPVNFISLIGTNAQSSTTLRVRLGTSQAQVDGSAPYDSGALTIINPLIAREDGRYNSHLELGSAAGASWWRIDIGSHSGDFRAAGLVMGEKITPSKFYDRQYEFGGEDLGAVEISRNGVVGITAGVKLRTLLFQLAWLTEAEYEDYYRPMVEALGTSGLVFWCFDPQANTYRQAKSYLGWFSRAPFARASRMPGRYIKEFLIRSLI